MDAEQLVKPNVKVKIEIPPEFKQTALKALYYEGFQEGAQWGAIAGIVTGLLVAWVLSRR